ncbi:MAG TPA: glycoside hydrolase domain-containing protein [Candidatus Angelobacter sp.]|jgi:hypothetical protein|nr:glycoside hydrolase domain-containing protein [Candidatus Angelobacter sp.]
MLRAIVLLVMAWASMADAQTYLGLDRNDYPGEAAMRSLRKTFSFTGYWLNNAPGADRNTWTGHRAELEGVGYGFLLLFNGREYAELKASGNAAGVGARDAAAAVRAAKADGFPAKSVIFLDQEQGGRMLPEQRAYIHAFVDGVSSAGYRAGIYCSGIAVRESSKVSIVTATDVRDNAGGRDIQFFISNDQCGPAPGCVFPAVPPVPAQSGVPFAEVWQYAQSPRRPEMTAACRKTYAADGNCYPPSVSASSGLHIDVSSANSPDPSHARSR